MKCKPCTLGKLFRAYDKSEAALIQRRNEAFPPGTLVKSRFMDGLVATVTEGSLYADQVNTNMGHMGWRSLEKVSEATDGKTHG